MLSTTKALALDPTNTDSRIYALGGVTFVDGSVQVTGPFQENKYIEFLSVSSPTVPSSGHARLWFSSSTAKVCTEFSDASIGCFGASNITSVVAGTGLSGGGSNGAVTVNLSTPIANSFLDPSSVTLRGANVINLQGSLQSGATFFVSSGTVNSLYASSFSIVGAAPRLVLQNTSSSDNPYILGGTAGDGYLHLSGGSGRGVKIDQNAGTTVLTADSSGISANSNKITNLTNGTASSDAMAYGQLQYFAAPTQFTDTASSSTALAAITKTKTTVSITPGSSSHHVKISVSGHMGFTGSGVQMRVDLLRGNTDLGIFCILKPNTAGSIFVPCAFTYLDAPASTTATVYTVGIRNSDAATTVTWNPDGDNAVIMVEEVN